eukprot:2895253-Prymnesium_polylepis.1
MKRDAPKHGASSVAADIMWYDSRTIMCDLSNSLGMCSRKHLANSHAANLPPYFSPPAARHASIAGPYSLWINTPTASGTAAAPLSI